MSTKAAKPSAPKKPQGAYFIFMNEKREEFKKKFPDLSQQDLIKQIAKAYKELNVDEKKQYEVKAHQQKEEYEKQKGEYVDKYGEIPKKTKESEDKELHEGRSRRRTKKTASEDQGQIEEETQESGKDRGGSKAGKKTSKGHTTSERLSEAGKKGAEARWGKRSTSKERMEEEGTQEKKSRSKSTERLENKGKSTHEKLSEAGRKGAEARWGKSHDKGESKETQPKEQTGEATDTNKEAQVTIGQSAQTGEVSSLENEVPPVSQLGDQGEILDRGDKRLDEGTERRMRGEVAIGGELEKPVDLGEKAELGGKREIEEKGEEKAEIKDTGKTETVGDIGDRTAVLREEEVVGQGDQNIEALQPFTNLASDKPSEGGLLGTDTGKELRGDNKLQQQAQERLNEEQQQQQLP